MALAMSPPAGSVLSEGAAESEGAVLSEGEVLSEGAALSEGCPPVSPQEASAKSITQASSRATIFFSFMVFPP